MPRAAALARARARSSAAHHRRRSSSSRRRPSSSSRAATSSSVPARIQACVLLLGPRDDDLAACALKLADVAAAHELRVVTLSHDDVDGLTRDGSELRFARGDGDGEAYALRGSGEDAAVVALDATDGILARLGYECVLCVVVGGREVSLGEDGQGSRARRCANRAAVAGTPTVCATIPTTTQTASIEPCACALEQLVNVVLRVLPTKSPANNPRSHFPFPTNGRWASLGTAQLPMDDELARQVLDDGGEDFAAKDCWSLGGAGTVHVDAVNAVEDTTPQSRRAALRDAFVDADIYLNLSVPAKWTPQSKFRAARPGVFWRQQRVQAVLDDEIPVDSVTTDRFGRTLPSQTVASDARATDRDARFVRQLATERLIAARAPSRPSPSSSSHVRDDRPAPVAFRVSAGVVVADDAPRGDLDAVARGFAAVVAVPTWPFAHAFALTDRVFIESLREDVASGVPSFLIDP